MTHTLPTCPCEHPQGRCGRVVMEPGRVYCTDCDAELLARASGRGRDLDVDYEAVELE